MLGPEFVFPAITFKLELHFTTSLVTAVLSQFLFPLILAFMYFTYFPPVLCEFANLSCFSRVPSRLPPQREKSLTLLWKNVANIVPEISQQNVSSSFLNGHKDNRSNLSK